jgi:hypothetical protein
MTEVGPEARRRAPRDPEVYLIRGSRINQIRCLPQRTRATPDRLIFEADVVERVRTLGGLFEPVLTLKQRLPAG